MSWTPARSALYRRIRLAMLLVGIGGIQCASLLQHRLGLSEVYPYSVAAVFVAAAALALRSAGTHHPFERFGPANGVTSVRLMLTSAAAGFVAEAPVAGIPTVAAVLAIVVTALDGADGWLARRTGMASDFGARYDMETDALLILVLAVLAWQHDKAGWWIVLTGAMRYLFVAASYIWTWMEAPLPPSQRRKAVCVVQIVGLGLVVSPLMAPPISTSAAAVTLAALAWSFGVDVLWLWTHQVRPKPDLHHGSQRANG